MSPEPSQIEMMGEDELRRELNSAVGAIVDLQAQLEIATQEQFRSAAEVTRLTKLAEYQPLLDELVSAFGWTDRSYLHAVLHVGNAVRNLRADLATARTEVERLERESVANLKHRIGLIELLHKHGTGETDEKDGENVTQLVERLIAERDSAREAAKANASAQSIRQLREVLKRAQRIWIRNAVSDSPTGIFAALIMGITEELEKAEVE